MATTTSGKQLVGEWRALLARHARVSAALEKELQQRHSLSVTEFEALQRLAEQGADGCRLQRLVDDIHMSQSALSRLVGRLEERGLVARRPCDTDRRGMFASITAAGREAVAQAEPTQQDVLRRTLAGD